MILNQCLFITFSTFVFWSPVEKLPHHKAHKQEHPEGQTIPHVLDRLWLE